MGKLFSININVSEIEALRDRLGDLDPAAFGYEIVSTLNRVTSETYDLARTRMIAGINLDDQYVQSRMQVRPATNAKPIAEIVALGDRKMMTGLGHYGALQLGRDTRWETEDGPSMGYKIGPWPRWEPRRGDPGRNLSAGEKQDGFQVEVKRGNQKRMPRAFTIPGKQHSDGSPVLFYGTGKPGRGKMDRNRKQSRQGVESLYGPSVYQLFRYTADRIYEGVTDNLEASIVEAAERELQRAIK